MIGGEDPRVPDVLDALALPDAGDRTVALAELGIGAVVRERSVPTTGTYSASVVGTVVHDGADLEVTVLDVPVTSRTTTAGRWMAVGAAWTAYLVVLLVGLAHLFWGFWSRMRTRRGPG